MSNIKVDPDAIEWFVKEGGIVSPEMILEMVKEIRDNRKMYDELRENGCGYNECGMAACGFSKR